jgi:hypothetical protein
MSKQIEALKLALEGVEIHSPNSPEYIVCAALIEALRENAMREVQRLGQEIEQEPVAWINEHGHIDCGLDAILDPTGWTPLYTHPPQRKPLTDEEIAEFAQRMEASDPTDSFWREFARAIEAAHGIRELHD